jgi:H+/Cl- antiporter ClcA
LILTSNDADAVGALVVPLASARGIVPNVAGGASAAKPASNRFILFTQWVVFGCATGCVCGAAVAIFLWLIDRVTAFRTSQEYVVYALPAGGLLLGWLYERFAMSLKTGPNLIIDTIETDGAALPRRMAPIVVAGTVLTHALGGSGGRAGAAIQIGSCLSDVLCRKLKTGMQLRRQLLAAGVASGFSSVFGTPVAAAVFGLEFVGFGRIEYQTLIPSLVAAIVSGTVTRSLSILPQRYAEFPPVAFTPALVVKWVVFGAAVAAVAAIFLETAGLLRSYGEKIVPRLPLRMGLGGLLLVGLWKLAGASDYLGLGLPVIAAAFNDPPQAFSVFAWKGVFTVVTIGAGYRAGEITPLLFIGAAFGSAMASILDIPVALAAGVGWVAVFAAAANTPVALAIMAAETLGLSILPHALLVCGIGWLLSGRRSLYPSQRRLNSAL